MPFPTPSHFQILSIYALLPKPNHRIAFYIVVKTGAVVS
jgi:hypothetical protein